METTRVLATDRAEQVKRFREISSSLSGQNRNETLVQRYYFGIRRSAEVILSEKKKKQIKRYNEMNAEAQVNAGALVRA